MDISQLIKNISSVILLLFAQVLIFNNIHVSPWGLTPFLYILLVMLLPFDTAGWIVLLTAFGCGLFVDVFSNSFGVHATALVFTAFFRPAILNILAPRDGYETGLKPRIEHMGFIWFLSYTAILVIPHHFAFYLLDVFGFTNFHITLLKIISNTFLTTLFVVLSQYFIFRK